MRVEKFTANAQRGNVDFVTAYTEEVFSFSRRRLRNHCDRIGSLGSAARQRHVITPYRAEYVLGMAHEVTIVHCDDCSRPSRRQQHWGRRMGYVDGADEALDARLLPAVPGPVERLNRYFPIGNRDPIRKQGVVHTVTPRSREDRVGVLGKRLGKRQSQVVSVGPHPRTLPKSWSEIENDSHRKGEPKSPFVKGPYGLGRGH